MGRIGGWEESRLELSVRGGKSLGSVDGKLQRGSMSSEVKGNAPDRGRFLRPDKHQSAESQIEEPDGAAKRRISDKGSPNRSFPKNQVLSNLSSRSLVLFETQNQ